VDLRVRLKKGADAASTEPSDWEVFIIEVNPNPYLEHKDLLARAAEKHGLSYADLIEKIVQLAMHRSLVKAPPVVGASSSSAA
jgi:D-alanine-D-alanine ligase-like ATP-grasp enzyme